MARLLPGAGEIETLRLAYDYIVGTGRMSVRWDDLLAWHLDQGGVVTKSPASVRADLDELFDGGYLDALAGGRYAPSMRGIALLEGRRP